MLIKTLATLGRISNLPTVWTNVLASAIVAQTIAYPQANLASIDKSQMIIVLVALSLMYIGGMFLNDAFDSNWDSKHNNMRPIVKGEIRRHTVWIISFILLISGLYLVTSQHNQHASIAMLALCGIIVLYNALHKKFPAAAFIMGLARFGVYIVSATLLAELSTTLLVIASGLLLYITGITYLARQEQLNTSRHHWAFILLSAPILVTIGDSYNIPLYWFVATVFSFWVTFQIKTKFLAPSPNIKAGIGGLLAAIPLADSLFLASVNALIPAIICMIIFLLIPRLHKIISGT